jgi:aspartate-semialdehyde dehydrogenase
VIPFPYAFNLFLHNSPLLGSDYCEEEMKMVYETRKILNEPQIKINATCVRVPVLRAHSEALNVEFYNPLSATEAYRLLEQAPGVCRLEDKGKNRFPMPIDAVGKTDVFYGRIRQDISQSNTLDLWVVADQLLKGAALNAVQIAELAFGIYTKSDRSQMGSMENVISS